jgi:hypothetical protein
LLNQRPESEIGRTEILNPKSRNLELDGNVHVHIAENQELYWIIAASIKTARRSDGPI